jgi:hypothetical protein
MRPPRPFQPKVLDRELEKDIQQPVAKFAESCGWFARKLAWFNSKDAPDYFFAKGGRILLVEFKRPGGEPRDTQRQEIAMLRGAGVEVHVIDNLEAGYALFT